MNCLEKWKTIDGIPKRLEVSNLGNVRRNKIVVKPEICKTGYLRVNVSENGIRYRELVHRLVAKAFIENKLNKPCVNHINGVKSDNSVENLEWVTYSENEKHSYDTSLKSAKGEKNGFHKLTEIQVREIRTIYEKRKFNGNNSNNLAKKYGVNPKTILDIVNRKNWKHVL